MENNLDKLTFDYRLTAEDAKIQLADLFGASDQQIEALFGEQLMNVPAGGGVEFGKFKHAEVDPDMSPPVPFMLLIVGSKGERITGFIVSPKEGELCKVVDAEIVGKIVLESIQRKLDEKQKKRVGKIGEHLDLPGDLADEFKDLAEKAEAEEIIHFRKLYETLGREELQTIVDNESKSQEARTAAEMILKERQ